MLKLQTPSIALARRTYGDQPIMEMLVQMISNVNDFFNVSRPMNAVQIMETAKLIAKVYYYLKFEEIKFVFENAKTGKWGKIYERLDGSVIMDWFQFYDNDRTIEIEIKRQSDLKAKQKDETVINYDELKKMYLERSKIKMNHTIKTHSLESYFDSLFKIWPLMTNEQKMKKLDEIELQNINGVMQSFIDKLMML